MKTLVQLVMTGHSISVVPVGELDFVKTFKITKSFNRQAVLDWLDGNGYEPNDMSKESFPWLEVKLIDQLAEKLVEEIKEGESHTLLERIRANEFIGNADILRFRTALETEQGTTGHPKAQKLWDLAWEHGHVGGWMEVRFWYTEMLELVN